MLPPSSSTPQGGLPTSPVKTEAASGTQEGSATHLQNKTAPQPPISPILSMARLQRLARRVKSLGAEYLRVAAANCKSRSDADKWSGGTMEAGEEDCNWVPQGASLHLTLQMPDPRVVEAAGDLLRGAELTAEKVKQFFLQVCSLVAVYLR